MVEGHIVGQQTAQALRKGSLASFTITFKLHNFHLRLESSERALLPVVAGAEQGMLHLKQPRAFPSVCGSASAECTGSVNAPNPLNCFPISLQSSIPHVPEQFLENAAGRGAVTHPFWWSNFRFSFHWSRSESCF